MKPLRRVLGFFGQSSGYPNDGAAVFVANSSVADLSSAPGPDYIGAASVGPDFGSSAFVIFDFVSSAYVGPGPVSLTFVGPSSGDLYFVD